MIADIGHLFDYPFMKRCAGTIVAVTAGLIGWFMVLRRQTFAGHTLAVIGFPGGAGAVLLGLSVQLGFFVFCIGGALVIAALRSPAHFRRSQPVASSVSPHWRPGSSLSL